MSEIAFPVQLDLGLARRPIGNRVAELFAGVGGFRVGLERAGWEVVWSNQWEPSTKRQHACECYTAHFGDAGHT